MSTTTCHSQWIYVEKLHHDEPAEIRLNYSLDIEISRFKDPEASYFPAHCPGLDLHSQGEDRKHAKEMINEAIGAFILSCYTAGILQEVLQDCGVELLQPTLENSIEVKALEYA